VTYDPARPALFAPTLAALGAWWETATPVGETRIRPAGIAALQDQIFIQKRARTRDAVYFMEAPDPAREIAEVARTIKQLLLPRRYRPDEIAIVSNQPDRYRELVRQTCQSYGLPVALPPEPLIAAPVVQALLGLARGDADARKSPYLPDDAAAPLTGEAPVADHAAALARALSGLTTEQAIINLMHEHGLTAETAALGARELAAYRAFLRTLVRLEQTYRQTDLPAPVSRAEFADLLKAELAEATYQTQARTPGPAVRFLVPAQTEGLQIPVVFAVGLSEGEFPTARADDWILPDRYRKAAPGRLVTREHHRQVERLQFLRVLRAATAELYLSRTSAGADGGALLPSAFWEEAMLCLGVSKPDRKLSAAAVAPGHFNAVSSEGELLQRLVQVLRHGSGDPQETAIATDLVVSGTIPGLTATEAANLDRRITAEDARWSDAYSPYDGRLTDATVTAALAGRLSSGHRFSASELETYAACPFRYLGERVLSVRAAEEDGPDLDAAEVGSVLHRILAAFYRTPSLDILTPEAGQHLEALVQKETAPLTKNLAPALQAAWRRQLRRQVMAWLEAERTTKRQAREGAPAAEQLTPAYLEWSFGQKVRPGCDPASTTEPLLLTATDGRTYQVAGVVDRIDLDQEGGYTVYDYKSGKSPSGSEITGSKTRLQIPLYL
ncbi:MAG TPA: PD-(D/E)XK nuclease family protein, partial [Symbiobacteriaceae bacterium]|nr:PD-(D/E)XK nuclease family protein [Symbiobacteriaceae bacterium]